MYYISYVNIILCMRKFNTLHHSQITLAVRITKLHYPILFSSSKFNKIYPIQLKHTLIIIRAKQLSLNIKVLSVMDMMRICVTETFYDEAVIISNAYKSYFKI